MIGSAFLRYFSENGYERIMVKSRSELDLSSEQQVEKFFERESPEIVIFAAGKVGGIIENRDSPADFIEQNLSIQLNAFKFARKYHVRKFIFFASSCMYPKISNQPMSENMLCSGHPEQTSIAYASAKYAGLQFALAINSQDKNTSFIPVIPNSVYGPNDNFDPNSSHVLSALIRKFHDAKRNNEPNVVLWGTGEPKREFLYVDDLVVAIIKILESNFKNEFLPINIGCGKDISIRFLAERVADIVGYDGKVVWDKSKPDGSPRKLLDNSRILSLGWKPETLLDSGIVKTYEWFVEHGQL